MNFSVRHANKTFAVPRTLMLALLLIGDGCVERAPADNVVNVNRAGKASNQAERGQIAAAVSVLAHHQRGPEFVTVDDRYVYWTNFEDDSVMKVDKAGGISPVVAAHNDPFENKAIAAGPGNVVWGGRALRVMDTASGRIQELGFDGSLAYNPVLVGTQLFFAAVNGSVALKALDLTTGRSAALGPSVSRGFKFATDGKVFYVSHPEVDGADAGYIEELEPVSRKSRRLATSRYVWQILVDDRYVYWLEGKHEGALKRVHRRGRNEGEREAEIEILAEGLAGPQAMAMDEAHLFWTELGVGSGSGRVAQIAKSGSQKRVLAENQTVPQALTVDRDYVYWVNYGPTGDGSVNRIAKASH